MSGSMTQPMRTISHRSVDNGSGCSCVLLSLHKYINYPGAMWLLRLYNTFTTQCDQLLHCGFKGRMGCKIVIVWALVHYSI